ncbi:hypothetical protein E4U57_004364 [Claviceps arundinis]|uniref:Rhamnogalacturonase A/B/Epimerase-like pectate lyase domain-containing protein n=1 Tax=Claviceps arundinis TaxID=1623583 RepID=A0A9P7MMF6_9HYPO|nr:hypothetical protein E4U57_004364 [Claviceps arundinis]KAG5961555.1 hypothetical protein E4U56_003811 [Claviceps arundinis]
MVALLVSMLALWGSGSASPQGKSSVNTRASGFWYPEMDHVGASRGYAPYADNATLYPVFQSIKPGDGGSIQAAIDSAVGRSRQDEWLASQPRVVYLPSGTYTVSKTIKMRTDTIIMGDPIQPPVLKPAHEFDGDFLINGQDPATGIMGELSFAVGLKNLILDTTSMKANHNFTALYWGVAQVAQLQNIKIQMPPSEKGKGHTGIKLGRGSTLGLADVRIEKGQIGIWHGGHQQALYKSIYFYKNAVGMLISGGNTISLLAPTFDTCGAAVQNTEGSPFVGIIDARSINSGVTFNSTVYPSIVIDNLFKDTDSDIVQLPSGTALGPSKHVKNFSYGNTVGRDPIYGAVNSAPPRSKEAAPGGRIPVLAAPTYADKRAADFINVKDPKQNGGHDIKGDGKSDEAASLNKVLQFAVENNKIAYFPYGDYRVESTLHIPIGSRIVGEAWSTISGAGKFFNDDAKPQPVVQIGKPGDVGTAHIQDMRFTVADVLPGAIIVQFQAAGTKAGDVALWNSFITVGGTRGATALTDSCKNASKPCMAAFIGLHFAKDSSAYVENVWNWVADHIAEGFDGGSSIAAKGGALVESTKGTWLHALGSEHWWLYQLNLRAASNVVVTLLQSETNYEQGDNAKQSPPAPWTADVNGWGDPDFSWCGDDKRCRMGPANYIQGGSDIIFYGSASWVFFSGPGYQKCSGPYECQKYMHYISQTPINLQAYGLCAKDTSVALRLGNGTDIMPQDGFSGGWSPGSDIGRYTT